MVLSLSQSGRACFILAMALHRLAITVPLVTALQAPRNYAIFSWPRSGYFNSNPNLFGAPLLDSPSDQNKGERSPKYSAARVGGRRTKKHTIQTDKTNTTHGLFAIIRQLAIPILLVSIFLRLLFGNLSGGTNPNVVYYSSRVYQSTTYSRDGNIETKRKESFESNIPGLVEKARERSQKSVNSATRGSYYNINSALEDVLIDVEDDINSIFGKKW